MPCLVRYAAGMRSALRVRDMSTARRIIERANLGVYVRLSLIATLEIVAGR